jgi:enoyl-[acyl-carrier protein] reductase III
MSGGLFDLTGKRVLVTGGTRGIGRAISAQLARAGAAVVANYVRNDDFAESLKGEMTAGGAVVEIYRADLSTPDGITRLVDALGPTPLSALVHCAATGVHGPIETTTPRHWDFTFALNVRAFFSLVKALVPRLSEGASIVALSSEGAVHAFPHYGLVGASKGALEALCRHLALELAPLGVRVNVLSPGTVLTGALDAFPGKDALLRRAIERSPRGRLTTTDEVAYAAHFLCSDASVGVNGHTLVVDGGQRIRG